MGYLDNDPMPFLEGDPAIDRVRRYFRWWSGRHFDVIGENDPNAITGDDLVAVSLLSIEIPPEAAIAILEDKKDELVGCLKNIPQGKDAVLWEVGESTINEGSQADSLWQILHEIDGIGWVTAHKLCARKRPHLLPVYDSVVKAALQPRSREFWKPLRKTLVDHPEIVARLEEVKEDAGIDKRISLLRTMDVAVWMSFQES